MDKLRDNYGQDIIKRGEPKEKTHKIISDKLDYFK